MFKLAKFAAKVMRQLESGQIPCCEILYYGTQKSHLLIQALAQSHPLFMLSLADNLHQAIAKIYEDEFSFHELIVTWFRDVRKTYDNLFFVPKDTF